LQHYVSFSNQAIKSTKRIQSIRWYCEHDYFISDYIWVWPSSNLLFFATHGRCVVRL